MAMRDLVTGGAACAVPGSSSSNPFGALANTLIGSSSKTQERLKEIPTSVTTPSDGNFGVGVQEPLATLPGSEIDHPFQPNLQGSEFLQGFRTADQNSFADVWDGIQRPQLPHSNFPLDNSQLQPELNGPPQRVLSNFLHSFVNSSHGGIPFRPASLPALGLSQGEKQCIRDRSTIMARHFFADKNEDFINAQVNALLCSLDIDADIRARGPMPGRLPELEDYWNESQGIKTMPQVADSWAAEFGQRHMNPDTNAWVRSFEQQNGVNGWASEFEHEQSQLGMIDQMSGANIPSLAAMEQTRMLAHTLAQNRDPKFQNSRFLQFVSKMSRGEITIEDNQIKPAASAPGDWATEYEEQYSGVQTWADQYEREGLSHGPNGWANEFAAEQGQHGSVNDEWVDEFSKLNVDDWADEFGRQVAEGALGETSADNWADAYDEYVNEQTALKQRSETSRGIYEFSDLNLLKHHGAKSGMFPLV